MKCLEKEPARRYASALELAEELDRFQAGEPIRARPVGRWERGRKWARRRPALATAYGLAGLVLVFGVLGGGAAWLWQRAESALQQAESAQTEAEQQRQRAESFRLKAERLSATAALDHALNLAEHQDVSRAMLWLARGLKNTPPELKDYPSYLSEATVCMEASVTSAAGGLRGIQCHTGGRNFSPDGKTVVTLVQTIRPSYGTWPRASPEALPCSIKAESGRVAFSPDGKTVLTETGRQHGPLWDAATGKPRGAPLQHQGMVWTVAFSPDGKTVLTGSADKTARLWETATGKPQRTPLQHQGEVEIVMFSPDGKTILTRSGKEARLWDVATCKPRCAPLKHQGEVYEVAFSPDGKTVLTGSRQDGPAVGRGHGQTP